LQDILIKGAARPKPKKRFDGPARPQARPPFKPPQHKWPKSAAAAVHSSDESDSMGSETGSESDYSSHVSGDESPVRQPAPSAPRGGYNSRRRQWASEESNSPSDEEIVPYW